MRCFYVLKKWSFAKLSLNRDLSLNKVSLNRDCTVSSYSGKLNRFCKSITLLEGKNSCTSLIMNGLRSIMPKTKAALRFVSQQQGIFQNLKSKSEISLDNQVDIF